MLTLRHIAVAAILAAGLTTTASAHPKLVAASPAANAAVSRPTRLSLQFSERLVPKLSKAELVMTGMPGMAAHPPMNMSGLKSAFSADGKTLVLTPSKPLPAGSYRVNWSAVAADTHRIQGSYNFSVK